MNKNFTKSEKKRFLIGKKGKKMRLLTKRERIERDSTLPDKRKKKKKNKNPVATTTVPYQRIIEKTEHKRLRNQRKEAETDPLLKEFVQDLDIWRRHLLEEPGRTVRAERDERLFRLTKETLPLFPLKKEVKEKRKEKALELLRQEVSAEGKGGVRKKQATEEYSRYLTSLLDCSSEEEENNWKNSFYSVD